MRYLDLDASGWRTVDDFYRALLDAIGARHGWSPDALVDSMIWGGINSVEPPFTVRISGTAELPGPLASHIDVVVDCLQDGRRDHLARTGSDVEASVEVVSC